MSGEKLIIRGGRVIDPANSVDASLSVCIGDGKIEAVGDVPAGFVANQEDIAIVNFEAKRVSLVNAYTASSLGD